MNDVGQILWIVTADCAMFKVSCQMRKLMRTVIWRSFQQDNCISRIRDWISSNIYERSGEAPPVRQESALRHFPELYSLEVGNCKGDILAADVEELQNNAASLIYFIRPNSKEGIAPKEGDVFEFHCADFFKKFGGKRSRGPNIRRTSARFQNGTGHWCELPEKRTIPILQNNYENKMLWKADAISGVRVDFFSIVIRFKQELNFTCRKKALDREERSPQGLRENRRRTRQGSETESVRAPWARGGAAKKEGRINVPTWCRSVDVAEFLQWVVKVTGGSDGKTFSLATDEDTTTMRRCLTRARNCWACRTPFFR